MKLIRKVNGMPVVVVEGKCVHTFPANVEIPKNLFDKYFGKPKRPNLERQLRRPQTFERIVLEDPKRAHHYLVVPMGPKGFTIHSA
jgi:hypothetical protein